MHAIVWPGRLFEPRILDRGEGQLVEVEMLDVRNPLLESSDEDGMWKMTLTKITITTRKTLTRQHWYGGGAIWACTKIAKVIPRFHLDGKSTRWIGRILAEKAAPMGGRRSSSCME